MNAIIHKKCGAVVVYSDHLLESNEGMFSSKFKTVNGGKVVKGSVILCPFCHDTVRISDMRQKDLAHESHKDWVTRVGKILKKGLENGG